MPVLTRKRAREQRRQKQDKESRRFSSVDVFMMQDRLRINGDVTRAHLRDMLKLPLKKEGEKGLFDHIIKPISKNN
tara:strand:+ start:181 stop:408 length:228 start_codon:yes stop_codon:yes gene_type:complete